MTRYTAAYELGFLARFTAAVASAVPEFDPATNPIGHALAAEIFAAPQLTATEPRLVVWPEPTVDDATTVMAVVGPVAGDTDGSDTDDGDDTGTFGELVELPRAAAPEWFDATTEPDEETDGHDDQVRMAG